MSPRQPRASRSLERRPQERRHNPTLREVLDELVDHVRDIARRAKKMTPEEMDYAQQRLEWLADEVWRIATERGED